MHRIDRLPRALSRLFLRTFRNHHHHHRAKRDLTLPQNNDHLEADAGAATPLLGQGLLPSPSVLSLAVADPPAAKLDESLLASRAVVVEVVVQLTRTCVNIAVQYRGLDHRHVVEKRSRTGIAGAVVTLHHHEKGIKGKEGMVQPQGSGVSRHTPDVSA